MDSRDPAIRLAAVAAVRDLVEELEELHVDNARQLGWSWQAIVDGLGITRQSVQRVLLPRAEDVESRLAEVMGEQPRPRDAELLRLVGAMSTRPLSIRGPR